MTEPTILVSKAALGVSAGVSAAILVALLVVASLLQLSWRPPDDSPYSLSTDQMWTRTKAVLKLVELLAYFSGAGVLLGLGAMVVDSTPLEVIAFGFGLVVVFLFSIISVLAIHWFTRSRPD
ncbi:MAG: hypothetical protein M3285_03055 [Actinomycetota bacterium]|nr:hypothetical protein [Actinomycetota bacterium]